MNNDLILKNKTKETVEVYSFASNLTVADIPQYLSDQLKEMDLIQKSIEKAENWGEHASVIADDVEKTAKNSIDAAKKINDVEYGTFRLGQQKDVIKQIEESIKQLATSEVGTAENLREVSWSLYQITESQKSSVEATKMILQNERKMADVTKAMLGLGIQSIAMNRAVAGELERRLQGASEEELKTYEMQQIQATVAELKRQQDIMFRQENLEKDVKEHGELLEEIIDNDENLNKRIEANEKLANKINADHNKIISDENRKNKELYATIAEQKAKDEKRDTAIAEQKAKGEKRDTAIAEQKAKGEKRDAAIAEQKAKGEKRDEAIAELKTKGEKLDAAITELKMYGEERDKVFAKIEDKNAEQDNRLQETEDKGKELDKIINELKIKLDAFMADQKAKEEKHNATITELRVMGEKYGAAIADQEKKSGEQYNCLTKAQDDYSEQGNRIYAIEECNKKADESINELKMKIEEATSTIEELEKTVSSLKDSLEKKSNKIFPLCAMAVGTAGVIIAVISFIV